MAVLDERGRSGQWLLTSQSIIDRHMLSTANVEAGGDQADVTIPHWTYHDLRHTVATGMQRLKQPQEVVDAVLNHKSGKVGGVAAIYQRYAYADEKQAALEAWAGFLVRLTTGVLTSNVVPLRA